MKKQIYKTSERNLLALYSEWQRTHDERVWAKVEHVLQRCPRANLRNYFAAAF